MAFQADNSLFCTPLWANGASSSFSRSNNSQVPRISLLRAIGKKSNENCVRRTLRRKPTIICSVRVEREQSYSHRRHRHANAVMETIQFRSFDFRGNFRSEPLRRSLPLHACIMGTQRIHWNEICRFSHGCCSRIWHVRAGIYLCEGYGYSLMLFFSLLRKLQTFALPNGLN